MLAAACGRQADTSFVMSANMARGLVSAAPILTVPPVGAFQQGPSVSFTPQRTLTAVAITFEFIAYMSLNHADAVFWHLPGFQCSSEVSAGEASFQILPIRFIDLATYTFTDMATKTKSYHKINNLLQILAQIGCLCDAIFFLT